MVGVVSQPYTTTAQAVSGYGGSQPRGSYAQNQVFISGNDGLGAAPAGYIGDPQANSGTTFSGVGGTSSQAMGLAGAALGCMALVRSRRNRNKRSGGGVSARAATATAARSTAADDKFLASIDHEEILARAPKNLTEIRKAYKPPVDQPLPRPKNDLMLRMARGEPTHGKVPKWMMRQAGRYLPEFRAIRAANRFFEVCQSPALAAEVTLQPLRRYPDLDAGIIFSDILVIPQAMGQEVKMVPGLGPMADKPIRTVEDMKQLNMNPDVEKTLGYVFDAIYHTVDQLDNRVPIIGFSGAPWTLMAYMIEGGGSKTWEHAKRWLYEHPEESKQWLRAISDIIVKYLVKQYDAGAPILQVFDTNAGEVPPALYEKFMVEDLKYIAEEVKKQRPHAILSIFPRNGPLAPFNDSAYDIVGVSWTVAPEQARRECPDKVLQGNLDPVALFSSDEEIDRNVDAMMHRFGTDKYIANLGHGMMPNHTPRGAKAFVDGVTQHHEHDH